MRVFGIGLMALGVIGLLWITGHIAWQQVQRLAYLHRLDRWGEPARHSDDEWSQDIPEWH